MKNIQTSAASEIPYLHCKNRMVSGGEISYLKESRLAAEDARQLGEIQTEKLGWCIFLQNRT